MRNHEDQMEMCLTNSSSYCSNREALGRKGDRTWHDYGAPIMTINAQALANNMPKDVSYTRDSQSLAVTRDFGAPKPHKL
jgi:hypothetical protein